MELEVFKSKRGTQVVTASNLYQVLDLPPQHYSKSVRKWVRDIYEFRDGIRRPIGLRDFAKRPRPGEAVEDYFLTLEMAKLITLHSNSKNKMKFARLLDALITKGQMNLFQHAA